MDSQQIAAFVEKYAYEPTGQSVAAAAVCSAIYFLFAFLAVADWIYTKYSFYDVPIISAIFRGIAFAARAAYLAHYKPALQGVFLAFANAGYGANVAAISLVLFTWFGNKREQYFSPACEKALKWWSICLALCIVCFGPCVGVVAAGTIFGAYGSHPHAAYRGQIIRSAASYGLLSTNFAQTVTLLIISARVLTKRRQTNKEGKTADSTSKNSRLVWILALCSCLLMVRGATGVCATYMSKEWVWLQDKYFYPLDSLFEFIVLAIMVWPALLARIACAWPKDPSLARTSGVGKA